MPPSRAIAIAIRSSVTVSIAALTTGVFRAMCRENRLRDARVSGQDLGVLRDQQHVVEREAQQRLAQDRPRHLAGSGPSDLRYRHVASVLARSLDRPRRPIRAWRPALSLSDILRIGGAPRPNRTARRRGPGAAATRDRDVRPAADVARRLRLDGTEVRTLELRQLGKSGLLVSAVGLGTNNFAGRLDDGRRATRSERGVRPRE